MPKKYVMGVKADGKADVLSEQDITVLPTAAPGLVGMDLWLNRETPADLSDATDPVAGKPMTHEPPDGGAVFRVLEFMPGNQHTQEVMQALHASIDSVHVPTEEEFAELKHPSMHKTDTLNYFVLMTGQLWALTEGRDVLLMPGDVLVQRGCMHGWRNDGTEVARLVCVLIDSLPA